MTNAIKMTATFMTGALVGISFGLLIAPAKGNKTRAIIGKKARRMADSVSQQLSINQKRILIRKKEKDQFEHIGI